MRRNAFAVRVSEEYLANEPWLERAPPISPPTEHYLRLVVNNPESASTEHDDAIAIANRSLILLSAGQVADAIDASMRAVQLDPGSPQVHVALGSALSEDGRFAEAVEAYNRARAIDPADGRIALFLGVALAEAGRLNEATACYRDAISADPDDIDALMNLGLAEAKKGDLDAAVEIYRHAIRLAPDDANLQLIYGFVLDQAGLTQDAIEAFKTAITIEPARIDAYAVCGTTMVKAGRFEEAIGLLRQAATLDHKHSAVRFFLATAFDMAGQQQDALTAYRAALDLNDKDPAWHFIYGMALFRSGLHKEAGTAFQAAIDLDRRYPGAHYYLGQSLVQLGSMDEAIEAFRAAIPLDPGNITIRLNLGFALLRARRAAEAIDALAAAKDLRPGSAYLDLYEGLALVEMGRIDEAIVSYQRSLEASEKRSLSTRDRNAAHNNLMNALRLKVQSAKDIPSLFAVLSLLLDASNGAISEGSGMFAEQVNLEILGVTTRLLAGDGNLRQYSEMAQDNDKLQSAVEALRALDIPPGELPRIFDMVVRELATSSSHDRLGPSTPLLASIELGDRSSADAERLAVFVLTATEAASLPVDVSVVAAAMNVELSSEPAQGVLKSQLVQIADDKLQILVTPGLLSGVENLWVAQHLGQVIEYFGRTKKPPGSAIAAEEISSPDDPFIMCFARALLIPKESVAECWGYFRNSQLMAAAFDVPVNAMVDRIHELGLAKDLPDDNRSLLNLEQEDPWGDLLERLKSETAAPVGRGHRGQTGSRYTRGLG